MNLDVVKKLVEQSLKQEPTGNDWLDSRYNEQIWYVGHTQPYYRLFYLIAKEFKPRLTVELGSWQATAAAHFAVGNPAGRVVTVDIHKDDKPAQQRTIEAANKLDNLTYINKWTWDAADDISKLGKIDILFIDAWHDYVYAKKEWDLYSKLLSDTALIIADDITTAHNFDGMLKFWEELPEPKFLDSRVHPGIPMGFVYVGTDRAVDTTKPATARRTRKPKTVKSRAA